MAEGDLTASGIESGVHVNLEVGADGGVLLPENLSLSDASFSVNGDDLILSWPNGAEASVEGFGSGDMPSFSDSTGAEMSGDMAFQLAKLDSPAELSADFTFEAVGDAIAGTDGDAIGTVEEADGAVWAIRVDGTRVELKVGDPVFQGDVLESGPDGSIGVILADDTTFSMGEDGQMVLDEMIYDPASQEGSVSVSVLEGVFTFVSGQVAKTDPDAMTIDTPVATIGIRGTQVGINLSEEKGMDVVLMEEADGFVGEVVLQNDGGVEILNTAFAASQITSFDSAPAASFTIDTVQFLQSFGSALKALPAGNNANTYGADQQDLEILIEQAIEEALNAAEEEAEESSEEAEAEAEAAEAEAEAEAEAAEAEAEAEAAEEAAEAEAEAEEELAEAEEEAEELEILAAEAEAEAQEFADEVEEVVTEAEPEPVAETLVVVGAEEPVPQFELVAFSAPTSGLTTTPGLVAGTDGPVTAPSFTRLQEVLAAAPVPAPAPQLTPQEATIASLSSLISSSGGSGSVSLGANGFYSVAPGADGMIRVDLSARTESFSVTGGILGDSVVLGSGNDQIYTAAGDDLVNAGAGNDMIIGGSGEGEDIYIGGSGVDWLTYSSAPEGYDLAINLNSGGANADPVTVTLADGTRITIDAGSASDLVSGPDDATDHWIGTDSISEIENILAGAGNDVVVGSGASNVLVGGAGADHLFGGGGDDTLIGGDATLTFSNGQIVATVGGDTANDVLDGGTGFDIVKFSGTFNGFTIGFDDNGNLTLTDKNGGSVDTLIDIEQIVFGDGQTVSVSAPPVLDIVATGAEDTAIPLDITGAAADQSITVDGIPDGAVLSYVGTDGATVEIAVTGGTATLTGAQTTGLTITPPENDSADFSLTVTFEPTASDIRLPETYSFNVSPVTDSKLDITHGTAVEGQSISLDVSRIFEGAPDTSEALTTMNFLGNAVESVKVGVFQDDGLGNLVPIDGTSIFVTITVNAETEQLLGFAEGGLGDALGLADGQQLQIQLPVVNGIATVPESLADTLSLSLPENFSGDIVVSATATVIDEGITSEIGTNININVDGLADDVIVKAIDANVEGDEDNAISLGLSLEGEDEADVTSITISGVPQGATLSAGTDNGDGTYTLQASDLAGLTVTPPAYSDVDFTLSITATTADITTPPFALRVEVTAVANPPTLVANDLTVNEDSTIDLGMSTALVDTDGSEAITSVTISGIPQGATLSIGDNQLIVGSQGSISVSPDDLANLSFTPPADFNGVIELTVSSTSTEGAGGAATTSKTISIDVLAVDDVPDVTVQAASGAEDNAIPLEISAAVSGSEDVASVTIGNLPAGAVLSAGTDNGDGTVTLTVAQLSGLTITPPADSDVDFVLSVFATSTDGASSAPIDLAVNVSGVADAPIVLVNDASGSAGEAIALDFSATLADTDGSETLSVEIGNLPDGAVVVVDGQQLTPVNNAVTLTSAQLANVSVIPPSSVTGTIDLTITATASEDGTTATTSETLSVTIDPDSDTDTEDMVVLDVDVLKSLDVETEIAAGDLSSITISGLPDGAFLTAGTEGPNGEWTLTPDDLNGLQIALDPTNLPDEDDDEIEFDFTLDVSATLSLDGAVVTGSIEFDYEDDDNLLIGSDGDDTVFAGNQGDIVFGLQGDDEIFGGNAKDELYGGSGDDYLFGNHGKDELFGGTGNDVLTGGKGSDVLTGGEGSDTFIFDAQSGSDIITDIMQQDTIVFEGQEFDANDMIFNEDSDGNVQISFSQTNTSVTLEGVKMSDLDRNNDGDLSEGYSVTQDGDKLSVTIDTGDGTS